MGRGGGGEKGERERKRRERKKRGVRDTFWAGLDNRRIRAAQAERKARLIGVSGITTPFLFEVNRVKMPTQIQYSEKVSAQGSFSCEPPVGNAVWLHAKLVGPDSVCSVLVGRAT